MPTKRKKISSLPLATSLKGLHTIGVDNQNKSVKVSLEFVETAADNADSATAAANASKIAADNAASAATTAKTNADTATRLANEATTAANTAAGKATVEAGKATTAANSATAAATAANTAKANADAATKSANNAATSATTEAGKATAAASAANTAKTNADNAVTAATTAATSANSAATAANTAKTNADTATAAANTATSGANTAKTNADNATKAATAAATAANTAKANADAAASIANTAAGEATTAASDANNAASDARSAEGSALGASAQALNAASEARSASAMIDTLNPSSIAVDKIRGADVSIDSVNYSLISMNRPRNYSYFIAGGCKPLMPVFECRYKPSDIGGYTTSTWRVDIGTKVLIDAETNNNLLVRPIRIELSNISIPDPINKTRYLYIQELHSHAVVTLTQFDASKKIINAKTHDPISVSGIYELDPNTRFVSLVVQYNLHNWCTKLSVFCTGISFDSYFNNPQDNKLNTSPIDTTLRVNKQTGLYDVVTIHDNIRYITEKTSHRIYDRAERIFVKENIDVADFVKVKFGKTIEDNPYNAIYEFNGKTPKCGRIGVFIHKKWRQRIVELNKAGVKKSGRHASKYSLAKRSDRLPTAASTYLMQKGDPNSLENVLLHTWFTHATKHQGIRSRSVKYIQCYVSVYKVAKPISDGSSKQRKTPIGHRIYFRLCNRIILDDITKIKKRVWIVEE